MLPWSEFKERCITKKQLNIQVYESTTEYSIWAVEGIDRYDCVIGKSDIPSADQIDYEQNYSPTANAPLVEKSADGIRLVSTVPGIDPVMMQFLQGVSARPTPANPNIDWTVPYDFVQIIGASVAIKGATDLDTVDMAVGVDIPGLGWMELSKYAYDLPIINDASLVVRYARESEKKSNPIPRGLTLRMTYKFVDLENPSTPLVGAMYILERTYAQQA